MGGRLVLCRNINDEDDEDDEEPRPSKRRKRRLTHLLSLTQSSATQLERDDRRSEADHGRQLAPISNDNHISRISRSPSALAEPAPLAEYQEWPFQGFLKRTRIGYETTYNLEFQLPCISERLNLPVSGEAICTDSTQEASAKSIAPYEAISHSKIHTVASRPQIKRAPWTPEEDATVIRMKEDGCSWEEIYTAIPHRTKGTIQVHYCTKLKP